jgi:hypothetical protein
MNLNDIGNEISKLFSNTTNYFNPTSNQGNNFWRTPVAQGMANIQKTVQNVPQYFSPIGNQGNNIWRSQPVQTMAKIQNIVQPPLQQFSNKYIYNPETKRILPNSPLYDPEAFTLKGFRQGLQRSSQNPTDLSNQYSPLSMAIMFSGGMLKKAPIGPFSKDMVNTVRNSFSQEVRNLIGKFAQKVESNPNANRANMGALGEYINSVAETVFGKNAANMTNRQLKNAFDVIMQQAFEKNVPKSYSIGLRTQNVREPLKIKGEGVIGEMNLGQKLPEQVKTSNIKIKSQEPIKLTQKSVGDVLSSGQQNPSLPPIIPPGNKIPEVDPVQKIITALKEAKPIRGQQEAIYSKIRSQQAGALSGIGEGLKGEAGYYQKLGQLKGEMPKVQFESIKKQFTQPELDGLFNKIESSNLGVFEKVNAQTGLKKLLGAEGGTIPTQGELQLLNEVFPPEFIQAVLDNRSIIQKLFSLGENVLNLPRAMMATADLSAPLRQGVFLIGKPKTWLPAFRDMFKYAFSENSYKGLQENIKSRPTYNLMRENKLAITDMSPVLSSREEAFMSNLSEQIPIFGKLAKASNRAYSGFLNKLRADTFDDLVKSASKQGLNVDEIAPSIANFVNTATGRGNLPGGIQRASTILNAAFFSPRLMASRLNLLNPIYYARLNPFVRKEALKSLFTFAGTAGTILALSKLGGADVGTDPRSADFGKIKIGNTRYDPWGGFQQYIVAVARLLSGEMVSSTTGKEFKLGEGYKPTTRFDIVQRFLESKESPVLSFITSLLKGQTTMGEKVNIPVEIADRFIPMVWQDMYDLVREKGIIGIPMAIPGIFGVGSQTYTDRIPMTGKTATGKPNVQWRQAPGLGETILNKITGNQISDIPKDQWQPLVEQKKKEALWNINYSAIKSKVLETGESQTIQNPINGKTINVYLDNGVVKTKEIKVKDNKSTKSTKTKTTKPKKITIKSMPKPKKIRTIKIKSAKMPKFKLKKLKAIKAPKTKTIKLTNPEKKNIKIL